MEAACACACACQNVAPVAGGRRAPLLYAWASE
jgi:hypothetical protein